MNKTSLKLSKLKKIYITDVLGKARNDEVWTVNERKLAMLIFSKLSKHKMYSKDIPGIQSLTNPQLQKIMSKTERRYSIMREEFKLVTGTADKNIAREIRKTAKLLVRRDCELPNPFDLYNEKSFALVQFFSLVRYNDTLGEINITINEEALPYLLCLEKYTVLMFQSFYCLKNKYSFHIYMYCKIFQNKYTKQGEIESSLEEFKKSLGVDKRYDNVTTLKTYLLNVVSDELNDKTDLNFEYFLEKRGKKFSKITLKFSQKKIDRDLKISPEKLYVDNNYLNKLNKKPNSKAKIQKLSARLLSYGISKSKVGLLIEQRGEKICKDSIQRLLKEVEKGKKIKNTAGYLIKCIENSNKVKSNEIKTTTTLKSEKKLKYKKDIARESRFKDFDCYISKNAEYILPLVSKYKANRKEPFDNKDIHVIRSLSKIMNDYSDISENSTPLTTAFVTNGETRLLTYQILAEIFFNKKKEKFIRNSTEQITSLKKELEIKKIKLSKASDQLKDILKEEITNIAMKISELV